jgi:prepilin-type N-terminal cleavage/methylation domain-containing protein
VTEQWEARDRLVQRKTRKHRAFSLIELLVVISVAVVLTGLMFPAMSSVREDAHSLICASNQRNLAMGIMMYSRSHRDGLPPSEPLDWEPPEPQQLMAAHQGLNRWNWDGIGLLFQEYYCDHGELFYCPSHHGEHSYERYAEFWKHHNSRTPPQIAKPVYTNFHYSGHKHWDSGQRRRLLDGYKLVLVTDGLRTFGDFNHKSGLNAIHGDGSVQWHEDGYGIRRMLPIDTISDQTAMHQYSRLWTAIEEFMVH